MFNICVLLIKQSPFIKQGRLKYTQKVLLANTMTSCPMPLRQFSSNFVTFICFIKIMRQDAFLPKTSYIHEWSILIYNYRIKQLIIWLSYMGLKYSKLVCDFTKQIEVARQAAIISSLGCPGQWMLDWPRPTITSAHCSGMVQVNKRWLFTLVLYPSHVCSYQHIILPNIPVFIETLDSFLKSLEGSWSKENDITNVSINNNYSHYTIGYLKFVQIYLHIWIFSLVI